MAEAAKAEAASPPSTATPSEPAAPAAAAAPPAAASGGGGGGGGGAPTEVKSEHKGPRPPPGAPPPTVLPASVPLPADWKFAAAELTATTCLMSAAAHSEKDNWVWNSDIDTGIAVYTRDNPDGSARAVCGVGTVQASPLRCITEAGNTDNWKAWDPLLKGCQFKQLTPIHRVYHLTFFSYFPYTERDIVYLETKKQLPDGSLVLATCGIDYPDYPVTDAYVRANLKAGGWHARPVPGKPNVATVTYYMNMDPLLALIPKWVLGLASTRFPAIIDKLRANCAAPAKPAS